MAGEQAGAIPVGGIYASVNLDDGNTEKTLENLRASLELTDKQFDKLKSIGIAAMLELERAVTRETEHNLREKDRWLAESANITARALANELDADRARQRATNVSLAGAIQARATEADEFQKFIDKQIGAKQQQTAEFAALAERQAAANASLIAQSNEATQRASRQKQNALNDDINKSIELQSQRVAAAAAADAKEVADFEKVIEREIQAKQQQTAQFAALDDQRVKHNAELVSASNQHDIQSSRQKQNAFNDDINKAIEVQQRFHNDAVAATAKEQSDNDAIIARGKAQYLAREKATADAKAAIQEQASNEISKQAERETQIQIEEHRKRQRSHNESIAAQMQAGANADAALQTTITSTGNLAGQMDVATRNSRKFQYGLIQVAYAMDDAQYGARALTNNIASLASSFGGPYAGYIAIASTLTMEFYVHQKEIYAALGMTASNLSTNAQRMEELGKATNRTAAETRELNELKREESKIQAMQAIEGEQVKSQKEGVTKAIAATPGGSSQVTGELAGVLMQKYGATYGNTDDEKDLKEKEERLKAYKEITKWDVKESPDAKKHREGLQADIAAARKKAMDSRNETATQRAEQLIGDASDFTKPERLKQLENLVQENPDAFKGEKGEFAKNLHKATREGLVEEKTKAHDKKRNIELQQNEQEQIREHAPLIESGIAESLSQNKKIDKAYVKKILEDAGVANLTDWMIESITQEAKNAFERTVSARAVKDRSTAEAAKAAIILEAGQKQDKREVAAADKLFKPPETKEDKEAEHARQKAEREAAVAARRAGTAAHKAFVKVDKAIAPKKKSLQVKFEERKAKAEEAKQLAKPSSATGVIVDPDDARRRAKFEADEAKKFNDFKIKTVFPKFDGGQGAADRIGGGGGPTAMGDHQILDALKAIKASIDGKMGDVANNTKKMTNGLPVVLS